MTLTPASVRRGWRHGLPPVAQARAGGVPSPLEKSPTCRLRETYPGCNDP